MTLTTKIILNKTRQKKDGTYPLVIRTIYNRKVTKIPVGIYLKVTDWDAKNQRIKSTSDISDNITRLNNRIGKQKAKIYDVVAKLEDDGKINNVSVKDIRKLVISDKEQDRMDVFVFIQFIIDELIRSRKKGNAEVYKNIKQRLEKVHRKKTLSFHEINYSFLKRFEANHYANDNSRGGLSVYLRTLRAVYNRAINAGYANAVEYPFKDYKIKKGSPKRRALSENEFTIVKAKDLKEFPHLNEARKFFLASFYMRGMNWMDMAFLKFQNIERDFERIRYLRSKTNKRFSIKINEKLKEIILSYKNDEMNKEDFIFPILSKDDPERKIHDKIKNKRKRLNKNLKKIAEICEIEPFTIYAARHTYATMGKRKGVPTAVIQESLGHETESTTQNYLDYFENKVVDDYDEIIMND